MSWLDDAIRRTTMSRQVEAGQSDRDLDAIIRACLDRKEELQKGKDKQ
jgi:hypothetical protein